MNSRHMDHPENDLTSDADYANRFMPPPTTFDELADAPDPLLQAQANKRSTKQAIVYTFSVIFGTILFGLALAFVSRAMGGPQCDSGEAKWMCTSAAEIWWPLATSLVPVWGAIGCGIILYRKYVNYIRWRPWMGAFWTLIPWSMLWMTTTFQMSISNH
ncbi:hypothetical protein B843_12580 [Corynebacterium vitaeruminis DSM 20294]|uniref:Uncharacterized protein n=2 Tax=Corynebacterium vitaeruminis TaxID=38305 RepID=W5Y3V7_9CORY|nr:hypothetical protein B843_12580 [Corynebacterium vitaeruminis DSM 20294]